MTPFPPIRELLKDPQRMRQAIGAGADVDDRDEFGVSALHMACWQGRVESVRALIGAGADINVADKDGVTPLHMACERDRVACVDELLTAGADISAGANGLTTPVHVAANHGNNRCLQRLVDAGARVADEAATRYTLEAVTREVVGQQWGGGGYGQCARMLLSIGAEVSRSAFKSAVHHHAQPLLEAFIAAGADVNARLDKDGKVTTTALHIACRSSHLPTIRKLLDAGADVHALDNRGCTPLHLFCESATQSKDARVIDRLARAGADMDARDKEGAAPIHMLCLKRWALKGNFLERLIAHGSDINAVNNNQETPLNWLLKQIRVDQAAVRLLSRYGADWTRADKTGQTPAHRALEKGLAPLLEQCRAERRTETLEAHLDAASPGAGHTPSL